MTNLGLKAFADRHSLTLVQLAAGHAVTLSADDPPPRALLAAIERGQQHVRAAGWAAINLGHDSLWLALSPSTINASEETASLRRQLTWMDQNDRLTGLMTRDAMTNALAPLVSNDEFLCLYIAIQDFRDVDALRGTRAADMVLQALGGRLAMHCAENDAMASRINAHAFVVLVRLDDEPAGTAAALIEELGQPIALEFGTIRMRYAVGMATSPQHGTTVEHLIRHAELASREATRVSDGVVLFNTDIERAYMRARAVAKGALAAFTEGQLSVHYQLQVPLGTGKAGAEALIRWNHPSLGTVPPNEFLPVFEAQGLMSRLTEFVLETSLREWNVSETADMNLSINLPPQLIDQSMADAIADRCHRHQFDLGRLILEITEQQLPTDPDKLSSLHWLQQQGVQIAIDDFGVGQSCLARLGQIQFDELKIDRSLIVKLDQDGSQSAVIRSIIALAKSLGMKVVAEGVETEGQFSTLSSFECDRIQGFYTARPQPFSELRSRLMH
ncbi:EAL domain-containing protein [Litorivicinus lipolyticus]|uniref:EAL domain-containing protein n=1 Tax=Litorivicinus lipolyticus TaxID=418701 RepID=A0A5Q2Q8E2_9GAMM|nr:GGDEF domain-containing phosphodiesterase [Litorivicinus lipolyticus]QGG80398.1 EAL domain-containing protein [Litorivicinus lipolyticus]